MKIVITEEQHDDLVEMMTDLIKSDGWEKTTKLVNGRENLIKILGITSPMEFLHFFDDLDVVQSEMRPKYTLFRYVPGRNLMIYDTENEKITFNFMEIWIILENVFGLNYFDIKELLENWLGNVYNLTGVDITSDFIVVNASWYRSLI